ncbi:MAG TPA: type VI secretion system contractile sheath large subunit [Gemmatales bacterium]|nr:type VI secretion system contractile sheath large subunit [Gemmatales bacterium]
MSWRLDQWIAEELGPQPAEAQLRRLISLVDAKLAAQVEAIVHAPAFQQLEGAWRGLRHLVEQAAQAEAPVEVRVLDVTPTELRSDLDDAPDVEDTCLWREVRDGFTSGRPFSLLVLAAEVGPGSDDLLTLQFLALVGATWQVPVLADAAPAMLGIESWTDLSTIRESILERAAGPTHAAWRSFREKEDAAYAALALPPARARPVHQVAAFTWEENRARVPWLGAGMLVAATLAHMFDAQGVRFHDSGGEIAEVPAPTGPECRLAVEISERRGADFAKLGLTPLWPIPNTLAAGLRHWTTCHQPKSYHDSQVQAAANLMTRLDVQMSLTAFARALMVLARHQRLRQASAGGMQPVLQRWLDGYVATSQEPDRPLTEAKVTLGKPDAHRPMPPLNVTLGLKADPPLAPLRFALEIP